MLTTCLAAALQHVSAHSKSWVEREALCGACQFHGREKKEVLQNYTMTLEGSAQI